MNILKKINIFRRSLTKLLTKNIGEFSKKENYEKVNKEDIKRILVCRPNHRLGNLLLITPLVQELTETFPNSKIDLFVKGNIASIIFKNYENIDTIIQLPKNHFRHIIQYLMGWIKIKKKQYDLVINVIENSSSGRLSTKFANSKYKFYGDYSDEDELKHHRNDQIHIAKHPIYALRNYLSKIGIVSNKSQTPCLNIKLSASEIIEGKNKLKELVSEDLKTICLFTYGTGDKCYPESWWLAFYEELKTTYKNHPIIEILPVENISKINFKATTFYSQNIREICSLIANTAVFIGADSGMMHLASASQTPSIGLFSVTDIEVYQPYCNKSLTINTNIKHKKDIITKINKILLNE